mmetsp:Transcript_3370/g.4536  ORF Transcript_3370/g.4536 Transcript_3370/m.4536 type:complete len:329 (-) Transcript_3370:348-1334(-)
MESAYGPTVRMHSSTRMPPSMDDRGASRASSQSHLGSTPAAETTTSAKSVSPLLSVMTLRAPSSCASAMVAFLMIVNFMRCVAVVPVASPPPSRHRARKRDVQSGPADDPNILRFASRPSSSPATTFGYIAQSFFARRAAFILRRAYKIRPKKSAASASNIASPNASCFITHTNSHASIARVDSTPTPHSASTISSAIAPFPTKTTAVAFAFVTRRASASTLSTSRTSSASTLAGTARLGRAPVATHSAPYRTHAPVSSVSVRCAASCPTTAALARAHPRAEKLASDDAPTANRAARRVRRSVTITSFATFVGSINSIVVDEDCRYPG